MILVQLSEKLCIYSKIRKKQEHLAEEYFIKYNQIEIRINKYKQI